MRLVATCMAVGLIVGGAGPFVANADVKGVARLIMPAIRTAEEYLATYGTRPTTRQLAEWTSLSDRAGASGFRVLNVGRKLVSDQVVDQYLDAAAAGDTAFVIMTHNQSGVLRFPDGSNLALTRLEAQQKPGYPQIIPVSCSTQLAPGITAPDALSLAVGEQTAQGIKTRLEATNLDPRSVSTALVTKIADQELSAALAREGAPSAFRTVKYVAGGLGGGSIVVTVVVQKYRN